MSQDAVEFRRRLAAVNRLMEADGFDLVVAADNDEELLPGGHVRYLSNFTAGPLVYSAVVVPLKGEPVLVVPPGILESMVDFARETSWIADVRTPSVEMWPWNPANHFASAVASTINDYGLSRPRIGLCGKFPGIEGLAELLPDAEIADAVVPNGRGVGRDLVERARAVKSDWEIERLEEAQRLVEIALEAFMGAVQVGRPIARAQAEADWAARSEGAESTMAPLSTSGPRPWYWWTHHGSRCFEAGDLVAVELNARYQGYIAQIARSGVLGTPSPDQERVMEVAREALAAMLGRVAPGLTGADVFEAGREVIEGAGMLPMGRLGHGMGLSMAETLDILSGDDGVVEEGHCLELHAGVITADKKHGAIMGDQYVIRDGKPVLLAQSPVAYDLAPWG